MSNEDSNQVLYKILIERLEQLRTMDKEGDSDRRRHIARETNYMLHWRIVWACMLLKRRWKTWR